MSVGQTVAGNSPDHLEGRVKTDYRDAAKLAKLRQIGELIAFRAVLFGYRTPLELTKMECKKIKARRTIHRAFSLTSSGFREDYSGVI